MPCRSHDGIAEWQGQALDADLIHMGEGNVERDSRFGKPAQDGENRNRPANDLECAQRCDHGDQRMRQACRWIDTCPSRTGGFASDHDIEGRAGLKLFYRGRDRRPERSFLTAAAEASGIFLH